MGDRMHAWYKAQYVLTKIASHGMKGHHRLDALETLDHYGMLDLGPAEKVLYDVLQDVDDAVRIRAAGLALRLLDEPKKEEA